jgi:hypothetical protein
MSASRRKHETVLIELGHAGAEFPHSADAVFVDVVVDGGSQHDAAVRLRAP